MGWSFCKEMAMPSPYATPITLSAADRATLAGWMRRRRTAQALALRARIVLACAEPGAKNSHIARALGVSRPTVATWRQRFAEHGADGLLDAPRPGAPRKISDADVERLITLTLETAPDNATHWSTRAMASHAGMSQTAVSRIWRAFGLVPQRSETFKLSTDPLFVDKVRGVVGLYLHPPDHALVLCADEKPQIQALERTAPVLPLRPGQPERVSHDYVRHGTTDLFAALDVKAGTVIGSCKHQHRAVEFRSFLDQVDSAVRPELDIHMVLDNASTHKTPLIRDWLVKRPRWHLHFTPTSGSWFNLVECWFSLLTKRRLQRGVFTSTEDLEATIHAYIEQNNAAPRPFIWTKSADEILGSVSRFCQRTSNSDH
jgi:transposase